MTCWSARLLCTKMPMATEEKDRLVNVAISEAEIDQASSLASIIHQVAVTYEENIAAAEVLVLLISLV